MAEQRVMIFIDGSNFYHALKQWCGRTDARFERVCEKLVGARQLVRNYYYNAVVDQTREAQRYADQQRFFQMVRSLPYFELRLGRLVYQGWPNVPPYEKGIDVQIATDMLIHAVRGNYDVGILVSGDNDFTGALQAVKDLGKHVEVALFGNGSRSLRDVADRVVTLDANYLSDCWR